MHMDEKLQFADFPDQLLDWYTDAARDLPWRIGPKARAAGETGDPYRIWLSEIMLQQTAHGRFKRFFFSYTTSYATRNFMKIV